MNNFRKIFVAATIAASLLTAGAGMAQEAPLQVATVAQVEQVVTDASGNKSTRLVDAARVVPGQEVVYTITIRNRGSQPAEDVSVKNPIPPELAYLADSAGAPGALIEFSVDGGKSFDTPPQLLVNDEAGKPRAARPDEYTHVRFTLKSAVAPGQVAMARYRAVVR